MAAILSSILYTFLYVSIELIKDIITTFTELKSVIKWQRNELSKETQPPALTLDRNNSKTVDIFVYVYEAKVFFSSKYIWVQLFFLVFENSDETFFLIRDGGRNFL